MTLELLGKIEYLAEYVNTITVGNSCLICLKEFTQHDDIVHEIDSLLLNQFHELMNFEVRYYKLNIPFCIMLLRLDL